MLAAVWDMAGAMLDAIGWPTASGNLPSVLYRPLGSLSKAWANYQVALPCCHTLASSRHQIRSWLLTGLCLEWTSNQVQPLGVGKANT